MSANLSEEHQPIISERFCRKLHENERIRTERGLGRSQCISGFTTACVISTACKIKSGEGNVAGRGHVWLNGHVWKGVCMAEKCVWLWGHV